MDSTTWDDRYRASDLVWSAEPNLFLPPVVEGVTPGSALDLACGEGRNALWLAREGWGVTAVDYSPVGIEKASRLAGETSVDWVVDDVTTYRPNRTFDLVIIFYLHLPPPQMAAAFERAVAAVGPGGTLFGVGHALSNLTGGVGGPSAPEILWSKDRMAPLLADLDAIEVGERERYVESADATALDLVVWATRPPGVGR
jgi:SAM-dependent methyltransferase